MGSCNNCGSELPEGARICPTCGHPVGPSSKDRPPNVPAGPESFQQAPALGPNEFAQPAYGSKRTDGMAIASMVCGILGVIFFPVGLSVVLSIVAIVLGKQSRDRIEASDGALNGLQFAKAGFILGIVGVVLGLFAILVVLAMFGAFFSGEMRFG